ncbi:hypothetical protein [Actinocorallia lasiicapitis]
MGEAEEAGPQEATAPAEIGIKDARKVVGTLARDAGERDQITYLTYSGDRLAAIVPVEAARTRAEAAADAAELDQLRDERDALRDELKELRAELDAEIEHLYPEVARLRRHLTEERREYASRLEFQENYWANGIASLWQIMEFYCRELGRDQDLTDPRMARIATKYRHAREILDGRVRARDA